MEQTKHVDFFLVPVEKIEDVWMHVFQHLLKGAHHWKQFYSIDQIHINLIQGTQRLWVMLEGKDKVLGIVLTQLDTYPETKAVRILYLGGTGFKRSMMKTMEKIENWGRKNGATMIDILGRDEWQLLIKGYGYTSPGRVYRKEL